MNNLNKLTIKEALELLNNNEITSVELAQACLDQIKKYDQDINSFITLNPNAMEEAEKADEDRKNGDTKPLLGIPIALKDNFLTKGLKTTAASKVLENYIPEYDATVVEKLKSAGAVILGKLNHDAWAHGSSGENSDFGATKNPWNKDYVPGGSSSGSASSVAANFTLAATGTDTGGSIRQPASFTNTVGLKPTYGLVSRYGIVAMASSLDSIGHITKSVEDSALLLNITAGNDPKDATTIQEKTPDYTKDLNKSIKGLKIGVPREFLTEGMDPKIRESFEKVKNTYKELGAEIVDISLPDTEYGIACYYIIQPAEVSSNLARYDGIRYGNERSAFGEEAKRRIILGTFTLSSGYQDKYYAKAMQIRTLIKKEYDEAFSNVDALIAPVSPVLPWKLGEKVDDPLAMYLSDTLTVTVNLAGIPSLTVPSDFIDGLPNGFQIIGPEYSEPLLFQIGNAYEKTHERIINEL